MKKKIGKFIFDLVIKYVDYLDDENYDRLRAKTYRPAFTRRRPLPEPTGQKIQMFHYGPLFREGENPQGPRFL